MIHPIDYLINVYPTYNLDNRVEQSYKSKKRRVEPIQPIEPSKEPKRYYNHPDLGKLFDIYAWLRRFNK